MTIKDKIVDWLVVAVIVFGLPVLIFAGQRIAL